MRGKVIQTGKGRFFLLNSTYGERNEPNRLSVTPEITTRPESSVEMITKSLSDTIITTETDANVEKDTTSPKEEKESKINSFEETNIIYSGLETTTNEITNNLLTDTIITTETDANVEKDTTSLKEEKERKINNFEEKNIIYSGPETTTNEITNNLSTATVTETDDKPTPILDLSPDSRRALSVTTTASLSNENMEKPADTIKAVGWCSESTHGQGQEGEYCGSHQDCTYGTTKYLCQWKVGNKGGTCRQKLCSSNDDCQLFTDFPSKCFNGACTTKHCYDNKECPEKYGCYNAVCQQIIGGDCEFDCDCGEYNVVCFKNHCYCKEGFYNILVASSTIPAPTTISDPATVSAPTTVSAPATVSQPTTVSTHTSVLVPTTIPAVKNKEKPEDKVKVEGWCSQATHGNDNGQEGEYCGSHLDCSYETYNYLCQWKVGNKEGTCRKELCMSNDDCKLFTDFPSKCFDGACIIKYCYDNKECPKDYGCYNAVCQQITGDNCEFDCDCGELNVVCFKNHCYCKEGFYNRLVASTTVPAPITVSEPITVSAPTSESAHTSVSVPTTVSVYSSVSVPTTVLAPAIVPALISKAATTVSGHTTVSAPIIVSEPTSISAPITASAPITISEPITVTASLTVPALFNKAPTSESEHNRAPTVSPCSNKGKPADTVNPEEWCTELSHDDGQEGEYCGSHLDCSYTTDNYLCQWKVGNKEGTCRKNVCSSNDDCKLFTDFPSKCHKGACIIKHCNDNKECPEEYGCYNAVCQQILGIDCYFDCDCGYFNVVCYKNHCYCKEGFYNRLRRLIAEVP